MDALSARVAEAFAPLDLGGLPSPAHVLHRGLLEANLRILADVQARSGAKVLLALKGYAQASEAPLIRRHLAGTTASGLHEALFGREFFGGESHVYSPAYKDAELELLLPHADHLSFNSPGQWRRFRDRVRAAPRRISCGLRVNPEHAEVEVDLYNPCALGSRLGTPRSELGDLAELEGLEGLHFHTMCQQGADVLERTVAAFESKFGDLLPRMRWVNFGGGHHITKPGYDLERLVRVIRDFRARHDGIAVYLEPGEAIAIGTGLITATVVDMVRNGMDIAILDVSATCHMPDTLEMPYRAEIAGAGMPGEKAHTYRLGSTTCLAGDVIGDYSFDAPLKVGQRLSFLDMSHYTFVKSTTFNGIPLPALVSYDPADGRFHVVRKASYADYRDRLA